MSRIVNHIRDKKNQIQESFAPDNDRNSHEYFTAPVDLTIQFIGASGIPKMDVIGIADPYVVANLDDRVSYVSSVKKNTDTPTWNEVWTIKNVPPRAKLYIEVHDKDAGQLTDGYVGKCETTVYNGTRELQLQGHLKRKRGNIWIGMTATPADEESRGFPEYTFDGPVRYTRHNSPTVGHFTSVNAARLYCTWKIHLRGIPRVFGTSHQGWNRSYKAAQSIFQGPLSITVRAGIQAGHKLLYARTTQNATGQLNNAADFWELLRDVITRDGREEGRIKPAVYTYIIDDETLRFSETGAAFLIDFASKHALHSNCQPAVRYSGEFHPRPVGGWENFDESKPDSSVEWELVMDNGSGTYSPAAARLPQVCQLMEYNLPGIRVIGLDFKDEGLKKSMEACRDYALKNRGVEKDELQPHLSQQNEETLWHMAVLGKFRDVGKKISHNSHSAEDEEIRD
ncbi:hypothetical protein BOTBODRAFT_99148 [Botryobasidium botryosum FD-172 SS1]|uniref:C2 domain-containing protein n=1 Tax=Botryobasidium botryosum (strain FD-172 SS1) TaxID=930990 RepID=A0A067N0N9_BOTB1|nr:hypothetical protein BOTBODRAFT_99148 [Botryobasidium botryosum FD-172 SS1]